MSAAQPLDEILGLFAGPDADPDHVVPARGVVVVGDVVDVEASDSADRPRRGVRLAAARRAQRQRAGGRLDHRARRAAARRRRTSRASTHPSSWSASGGRGCPLDHDDDPRGPDGRRRRRPRRRTPAGSHAQRHDFVSLVPEPPTAFEDLRRLLARRMARRRRPCRRRVTSASTTRLDAHRSRRRPHALGRPRLLGAAARGVVLAGPAPRVVRAGPRRRRGAARRREPGTVRHRRPRSDGVGRGPRAPVAADRRSTSTRTAIPRSSRVTGGTAYALVGDLAFLHDHNGLLVGDDEPRPGPRDRRRRQRRRRDLRPARAGRHAEHFERIFGTPLGLDLEKVASAVAVDPYGTVSMT